MAACSLATFIIGQSYLTMLCSLRWGVYIFFAGFVIVMTLYVHFFLIETKGVPLVSQNPLSCLCHMLILSCQC